MSSKDLVLVTGGSGFLASHCILALLRDGYQVRTTVRALKRAYDVRKMLQMGGASDDQVNGVEFYAADLSSNDGWSEACTGCKYVLHVASPFPAGVPKHEDDLIVPAREGTLRALKAAKEAGTVKRVVVTSSFAAIGYGHPRTEKPFSEEDWSDLKNSTIPVPPYPKSKTIAERAAWDWIAEEGGEMELSVVNPCAIFGPILGKDYATSIVLVTRMMNGQLPGLLQFGFGTVDVRDAADLHLRAMTDPKAKGERFIAVSDEGFLWTKDMAAKLKQRLGDKARRVPTRSVPNFMVRLISFFDAEVSMILPELGKAKNVTNEKAKNMLRWRPRSAEDSLVATAESLEKFELIKP